MRAGELRRQITIEQRADTPNSRGEPIPAWSTFATVYAAIEPIVGREKIIASQVNDQQEMNVRIRYLPGVSPKMRIKYGTRTFQIEGVVNVDERDREMKLMCIEQL